MEISVAITNHPSALAPILAIAAAPSIRATPTTSVENTNGAMIILMRRKKLVVTREKAPAALSAAAPLQNFVQQQSEQRTCDHGDNDKPGETQFHVVLLS